MKKLIALLLLLIISAVIITAGCITPQETTADETLKGDWTTQKLIKYSSETGFSEEIDEGCDVLKITEQNGRLLKMEIEGANRIYYAAVSDKNGKAIFTDSSYGSANERLNGNILSENEIIFASARYDTETKEYSVLFDVRTKDGAEIKKPDEKKEEKSLIGSYTKAWGYMFEKGGFIPRDGKTVLKITEQNGPVFIGTITPEGKEPQSLAGVITSVDDKGVNALIVQSDGDICNIRISDEFLSLWNVDGSRIVMFANDAVDILLTKPELNTDLAGKWICTKASSLNSDGYSVYDSDISVVIEVKEGNALLADVSSGSKYRGKTTPFGRISLSGISADRTINYCIEGYISDDGKLYTYTTSKVIETGSVIQVTESIYTKSASKASGLA
ncbi:MAG: hypothetical protein Q4Q53_08010 [Methanocorpusculum sp.]|nr:hypothetical protein [Methanocorpusculum sp.]